MEEEMDMMLIWGTWEELVLGGAVLRHGNRSWDAVAEELRSRTFYPYFFTPEVCKAKYQDLQARYSGCTAWFEELRKQRVAQLKRELEKSEGSIGSLESKLETLKSNRNEGNFASGHTESPPSVGNLARLDDFAQKETFVKDGFSAGSFTEETQTDSSPAACQVPTAAATEGATSKENILKKRRGKRKRKECLKDISVRDTDQVRPVDKEESTRDYDRPVRSSNDVDQGVREAQKENVDLMSVFNSIVNNQILSSVFQRRTDSQKRGRYKKTIRQHMDLSVMRFRISDRHTVSVKELYRDFLLLCNNAILFYSKESRESKSAVSLRSYLTKNFWQNVIGGVYSPPHPETISCNSPPVKPRSARPAGNLKLTPELASDEISIKEMKESINMLPTEVKRKADMPVKTELTEVVAKKKVDRPVKAESMEVVMKKKADRPLKASNAVGPTESTEVVGKKRVDRPVKVGRNGGSKRVETPSTDRKKARKR